ncbi:unnamed protein product [Polarella glacialis]|uniref:Uncharacterized protein n=1 Tax=Polarella glacialis TaxID=89957 RepID=A0A813JJA9_POLGL|nr:unnamed protein product [Polarella glacialis]
MVIFATSSQAWFVHAVPSSAGPLISDRPVYTITYVEWLAIVPQLLCVAGYCALGRPLRELTRPVIVTNIYIVSAWMAQLVAGAPLRWALVAVTFALYGWASWDVALWARAYFAAPPPEDLPGRLLRPCLALGVNATFAVHAMVYLAAICGAITPGLERACYLALDVGVKLAVSWLCCGFCFVSFVFCCWLVGWLGTSTAVCTAVGRTSGQDVTGKHVHCTCMGPRPTSRMHNTRWYKCWLGHEVAPHLVAVVMRPVLSTKLFE